RTVDLNRDEWELLICGPALEEVRHRRAVVSADGHFISVVAQCAAHPAGLEGGQHVGAVDCSRQLHCDRHAASFAPSNCASSVEPRKASVEDCPPDTACATASK